MRPLLNPSVMIVDPRPTVRAALREIVEREWGWPVAGEAADGFEGVRIARFEGAAVLLVDAAVGGLDLRSLFEMIQPDSGLLVVGLLDFPHQHALARGVAVLKGAPPDRLRDVILNSLGRDAAIAAFHGSGGGAS